MGLRCAITDLWGFEKAALTDFRNAKVEIPYNDSRTATVDLSIYDPACAEVLPLERMLRVWHTYRGGQTLVFWGPILTPTWSGDNETVTVAAHDPTIHMKHHYFRYGDPMVGGDGNGSVTIDGYGLQEIVDAARNSSAQNADGLPDIGIANGVNDHLGPVAIAHLDATLNNGDLTMTVDSTLGWPTTGSGYIEGGPSFNFYARTEDSLALYTPVGGPPGGSGPLGSAWSGGVFPAGRRVFATMTFRRLSADRGDEVFQKAQDLCQLAIGPDFDLRPRDLRQPVAVPNAPVSLGAVGPIAIPDCVGCGHEGTPVRAGIEVTNPGTVTSVQVAVHIEHTFVGDLRLQLIGPDGTTVGLTDYVSPWSGSFGDDLGTSSVPLRFDDSAGVPIDQSWTANHPAVSGLVSPMNPLSAFAGKAKAGVWQLRVADWCGGDVGTIQGWGIAFDGATATSISPSAVSPYGTFTPGGIDFAPAVGTTPAYASLDIYDKRDAVPGGTRDRRDSALWHYGWGRDNVQSFEWTPGGDQVRNHFVAVTANTGPDGNAVPAHRQLATNLTSRRRFGTYIGWQAAGAKDDNTVFAGSLELYAQSMVDAYSYPPDYFTFTPKEEDELGDLGHAVIFDRDFRVGELVRVEARRGGMSKALDAIVTGVTLSQVDDSNRSKMEVKAIPYRAGGVNTTDTTD